MIRQVTFICGFLLMVFPLSCWAALLPEEILLVVNRNVPEGLVLAQHYRDLRQVPVENLLQLDLAEQESCSRQEYDEQVVTPLRALLRKTEFSHIRCLLLFYGMPLKVQPPEAKGNESSQSPGQQLVAQSGAALDSELVLAMAGDYPLGGWLTNPFYLHQGRKPSLSGRPFLVARLDAANPDIVKRMMADSIIAEKEGLTGRAYFDARWSTHDGQGNAYQRFDATIHAAAQLTRQISRLPVVLDTNEALLNSAPDAAIYCGWYRLADYLDIFTWQRGAVGYHVASGECASLRNPENRGWCKGILEAGGTATLGPVAEPYLAAFPRPDQFFAYLLDGYYTLVESYFFSLPYVSWQMILLGDPLYRPFRYL